MQRLALLLLFASGLAQAQAPDTLRAPVSEPYFSFGLTVDATDDWLFVGAANYPEGRPVEAGDDGGTEARLSNPYGSVFTYRLGAGAPVLTGRLFPDDTGENNCFSFVLDVRDDVAAIGAECEREGEDSFRGAAYVYRNIGGEWMRAARLGSQDVPGEWYGFGDRVALGDGYLVIRAEGTDGGYRTHVFEEQGDSWVYTTTLVPSTGTAPATFSTIDDESGSYIILGTYPNGSSASNGAVYVFRRDGSTWTEDAQLTCPGDPDRYCGYEMQGGDGGVVTASKSGVYPLSHRDGVWSLGASAVFSGAVRGISRWGDHVIAVGSTSGIGPATIPAPLVVLQKEGEAWVVQSSRPVDGVGPRFGAGPRHTVAVNQTHLFRTTRYAGEILVYRVDAATAAEAGPTAPALNLTLAPNPASTEARVRFETDTPGDARLVVTDVLGRLVTDRSLGTLSPGAHEIPLALGRVAAGVYVVRVEAGSASATRRLVVR